MNGIKLEDIDQKPQLMQQFPSQSFNTTQQPMMNPQHSNVGGGRGRGASRGGASRSHGGRGRGSPVKRKLGMPPSGGGGPPMKIEPVSLCNFKQKVVLKIIY